MVVEFGWVMGFSLVLAVDRTKMCLSVSTKITPLKNCNSKSEVTITFRMLLRIGNDLSWIFKKYIVVCWSSYHEAVHGNSESRARHKTCFEVGVVNVVVVYNVVYNESIPMSQYIYVNHKPTSLSNNF